MFQFDSVVEEEHAADGCHTGNVPVAVSLTFGEKFLLLELQLCDTLRGVCFPASITHIYNPLEYAFAPHRQYVTTYCTTPKDIVFLGINPGPFGMAQTGVMFPRHLSILFRNLTFNFHCFQLLCLWINVL